MRNNGYHVLFDRIKNYLKSSDICIANFETSINVKKKISGYPRFNAHPEILKAMKNAGINVISLANNHSLDMGKTGLIQTTYYADKHTLIHNGIAVNAKNLFKPTFFIKNGVKFSFLSLTTITNGLRNPVSYNSPKVNIFKWKNRWRIIKEIKLMKKKSDFVVISIHFGKEYTSKPNRGQKIISRILAKAGADLILGNHPHHIHRPAWIYGKYKRKTLVSYSQGNFISHQNRFITYKNKNSRIAKRGDSFLLNVYIIKDEKGTRIKRFTYTPTWTLCFREKGLFGFKAVVLKREINNPLFIKQKPLLMFRRKKIIEFMNGFILEELF
jgi:poly-gamma-glutamate capsule biosynthesis protein CapA/YwtB (metallophosphatase superfamily)